MLQSCTPKSVKPNGIVARLWCVSDTMAVGYETVLPSGKAQIIFSLSDIPLATHGPDNDVIKTDAHEIFQGRRPNRAESRANRKYCFAGSASALEVRAHFSDTSTERLTALSTLVISGAFRLRR